MNRLRQFWNIIKNRAMNIFSRPVEQAAETPTIDEYQRYLFEITNTKKNNPNDRHRIIALEEYYQLKSEGKSYIDILSITDKPAIKVKPVEHAVKETNDFSLSNYEKYKIEFGRRVKDHNDRHPEDLLEDKPISEAAYNKAINKGMNNEEILFISGIGARSEDDAKNIQALLKKENVSVDLETIKTTSRLNTIPEIREAMSKLSKELKKDDKNGYEIAKEIAQRLLGSN